MLTKLTTDNFHLVFGQFAPRAISPQFVDNSPPMRKHRSYWFTKGKESSTTLASQSAESIVAIVDDTKLSVVEFIYFVSEQLYL